MTDSILIYALIAALAVSLVLSVAALRSLRYWRKRTRENEQLLNAVREDVRGLCAGAVGVDERIARTEQDTRRLRERQEQLELREGGERHYGQAAHMAKKGASIEELVEVCGVSRGEAELIAMMHRSDMADTA